MTDSHNDRSADIAQADLERLYRITWTLHGGLPFTRFCELRRALIPDAAQSVKVPVVWASFTERGYVRFWTTDKMRAVAEMVAGTFNVKAYTVDDLMGMVVRASAAQPPTAPVGTSAIADFVLLAMSGKWDASIYGTSYAKMGNAEVAKKAAEQIAALFAKSRPSSSAATAVERFQRRIVEMLQVGWTGFHLSTGDDWHSLDIEEKCAALLAMWDAEKVETGPARTMKEPVDVREVVKHLADLPQTAAVTPTGKVHTLKTWPRYFNEVMSGRKPFEWRINDRYYEVGDTLVLQEWEPLRENLGCKEGRYTGRELRKVVSYIFSPFATNKATIVMAMVDEPSSTLPRPQHSPNQEKDHV